MKERGGERHTEKEKQKHIQIERESERDRERDREVMDTTKSDENLIELQKTSTPAGDDCLI